MTDGRMRQPIAVTSDFWRIDCLLVLLVNSRVNCDTSTVVFVHVPVSRARDHDILCGDGLEV